MQHQWNSNVQWQHVRQPPCLCRHSGYNNKQIHSKYLKLINPVITYYVLLIKALKGHCNFNILIIFILSFVFHHMLSSIFLCVMPWWKINSFLSEISDCWSCTEKIRIKKERAFSIILWASPAICRSLQQCRSKPHV